MTDQYSQEELYGAYFVQLVLSLQTAAMHQMGKIINPLTGKVEKDMDQAKNSIDMLAMLEQKTKGNLAEGEQKLIERALFELRMNYVDEMKVVQKEEPQEEAQRETGEETEEKREQEDAKAGEKNAGKGPKASSDREKAKPRKGKKRRTSTSGKAKKA